MPVTLINVFSLPKRKEEEFVKWWQDVKATIIKQPGFISGKFHKHQARKHIQFHQCRDMGQRRTVLESL
jgi:heme-degrading monooxygenase HmoA